MRIISLLPSNTELACALGLADQIVGISHECDYPPEVSDRPILTSSGIAKNLNTEQIHEQVSKEVKNSHALYHIDQSLLESLRPELILTQAKCDVCAVDYDEVEAAVAKLPFPHPKILSFQPDSLEDLFEDLRKIAIATGRQQQAETVIAQWRQRIEKVHEIVRSTKERPRVLLLEWLKPLMAAGSWSPQLVKLAGGEHGLNPGPGKAKKITWDQVRQYDPEVLVLIPCGFTIEKTLRDISLLTALPGWQTLSAVRAKKVFAVDGSSYFNRPGPRLVDSLEILASLLHPKLFLNSFTQTSVLSLY
ncbi:MAG: cobalamin-binding protein [Candidatus Omnitrophica bacterium]|nr:cobalamin-binding protein [Candidatus Omnitrophota bacterium]